MASGQLTVVNLTSEDLKIHAHQNGNGPKVFIVNSGGTTRKTGIRVDRSDWPSNYKRRVEFFNKNTGALLKSGKYKYKFSLAYELILSIDKIDGTYQVRVLSDIPTSIENEIEKRNMEALKAIVDNGFDHFADSDTEDDDANLSIDED